MSNDQILEELLAIQDIVRPPLYYATESNIELGKMLLAKETEYSPEYIVIHPDDFEKVRQGVPNRRLVPLGEWRPVRGWTEEWMERLGKQVRQVLAEACKDFLSTLEDKPDDRQP